MDIQRIRRKVATYDSRMSKIRKEREEYILKEQEKCQHPIDYIIEGQCVYSSLYSYSTSSPPFRVCKICGYAEEGWGCGYSKLKGSARDIGTLDHESARKYVLKFYSNKEHFEANR